MTARSQSPWKTGPTRKTRWPSSSAHHPRRSAHAANATIGSLLHAAYAEYLSAGRVVPDERTIRRDPLALPWRRGFHQRGRRDAPPGMNAGQLSMAPAARPSELVASSRTRRRRKGNFVDRSLPGLAACTAGSNSVSRSPKSFFSTLPSNSRIDTPETCSKCCSSGGVEKVLSTTGTPPLSAIPNTADTNSGRLLIRTPTRETLPAPAAEQRAGHFHRVLP